MQYLWVDSLCIVQDSTKDKIHEIAAMGEIYKSASVTIAAGNAEKVEDGFLSDWPPPDLCPIPFRLLSEGFGTVYLAKEPEAHPIDEPLFKRGWAFQEFVLSPRIILYDSSHVTFSCEEQRFKGPQSDLLKYTYPSKAVFSPVANYPVDAWERLISEYSAREFTFIEDRLPATAGIAKNFSEELNEKYIAGFWLRFLVQQLGWRRRSGLPPFLREAISPFEPFAHLKERVGRPSWSWKSAPFAVSIDTVRLENAEVTDYHIDLASTDAPFGDVLEGTLTLRAKLLPFPQKLLSKPFLRRTERFILDYDSTKFDSAMYALFLGVNLRSEDIALIVRKGDDDYFERIGFLGGGAYKKVKGLAWETAVKQTVVLM